MAIQTAKQRNKARAKRREHAVSSIENGGWSGGVAISTGQAPHRWPFKAEAAPIDKHSYRLVVHTTAEGAGPVRKVHDQVYVYGSGGLIGLISGLDDCVSTYLGIDREHKYGPWYYQMIPPTHLRPAIVRDLYPRILIASGPFNVGLHVGGAQIGFRVQDNEHIDSAVPYSVDWRIIGSDQPVQWSSLEYFLSNIIQEI